MIGLEMFHKAMDIEFKEGTVLEVAFRDGVVKRFDVATLFDKYPQLKDLGDRKLFLSGRLISPYGIYWNDELDLEVETVYQDGVTVRQDEPSACVQVGEAVYAARARKELSQKELSALCGIDQSDISKIERGIANPTISTLERIAKVLEAELKITLK